MKDSLRLLSFKIATVSVAAAACIASICPSVGLTADAREELESLALSLVNQERTSRGLPVLERDARLTEAARLHSEDMRVRGYMGHVSPDPRYRTLTDRLALAGASETTCAENVGFYGSNSPDKSPGDFMRTIHRNLMKSPRHRANILNPEYNAAGMGVATGEAPADGDPSTEIPAAWITQNFSSRRVRLDTPLASPSSDGLLIAVSGTATGGRLMLSVRPRSRGSTATEQFRLNGGWFSRRIAVPYGSGGWLIELCRPGPGGRLHILNAFTVDSSALPAEAVKPCPGDE